MALAVAVGLPLGILMGRFRPVEHFVLPLASALMPIPSLAWVPVFILWFGLGNTVAILIVFYAALFPMLLNTWSGVRAVNPLWLRAAGAMGANERALFWKVIVPGASPFIITGLRQAFLRAWIAVIGAEFLAASDWGLGWVIFDAKEFLNADVMLASLARDRRHRLCLRAAGVRLDRARHRSALGHGADGEGVKQQSAYVQHRGAHRPLAGGRLGLHLARDHALGRFQLVLALAHEGPSGVCSRPASDACSARASSFSRILRRRRQRSSTLMTHRRCSRGRCRRPPRRAWGRSPARRAPG